MLRLKQSDLNKLPGELFINYVGHKLLIACVLDVSLMYTISCLSFSDS